MSFGDLRRARTDREPGVATFRDRCPSPWRRAPSCADPPGSSRSTTSSPLLAAERKLARRATGVDADDADHRGRRVAQRLVSRCRSVIEATQIESPVCTPIGSMFSIEQIIRRRCRAGRGSPRTRTHAALDISSTRSARSGSRAARARPRSRLLVDGAGEARRWPARPRVNAGTESTSGGDRRRAPPRPRPSSHDHDAAHAPDEPIASAKASRFLGAVDGLADAPMSSIPARQAHPPGELLWRGSRPSSAAERRQQRIGQFAPQHGRDALDVESGSR